MFFFPLIIVRITGPLLRLYDSRATAVSPLSACGRKGWLFVTSVLELDGDVSLSLLTILSFSLFSVSVFGVHDIDFTYLPRPCFVGREGGVRVWGFSS